MHGETKPPTIRKLALTESALKMGPAPSTETENGSPPYPSPSSTAAFNQGTPVSTESLCFLLRP